MGKQQTDDSVRKKTKAMIFNFSKDSQFSTRLSLKGEIIDTVDKMKILGCIITNKLSWDENCDLLIRKVNARMQLLRKALSFGATQQEMVQLWIVYCRSVLEQSCVLWHSTLTQKNIDDLERCQKSFAKLTLKQKYVSYEQSLVTLNLISLNERRKFLNWKWAQKGIKNNTLNDLFPLQNKKHHMNTRYPDKYIIGNWNTERVRKSSIIYMRHLLNEENQKMCEN